MASLKNSVLRHSHRWHQWLGWLGGLALLIFALSGISHPLMTWTGPKAAAFFPPQAQMQPQQAAAIPAILQLHSIDQALLVKLVPSGRASAAGETGSVLLQVTQAADQPRRYFDLQTGEELVDYDQQQAIWLARYYTGLQDAGITSIQLQTEFDAAYPWVNRLLPVYRISFDTEDQRTAFIYTELGALAGLTNNWKTSVQSVFRTLHTWNWLDDFEYARVFLMLLLLLSLFGMALLGTALVFLLRNRKMEGKRKWHRYMAYVVWLPLLMFSASGIYHLLFYAYSDNLRGLRLGQPVQLSAERFGDDSSNNWLVAYQGVKLNALSLVEGPEQQMLYRLSLPQGKPGRPVTQQQRYDGVAIEKPALYFNAKTGQESNVTDVDMAIYHAQQQMGLRPDQIVYKERVTHFGPHYDFRNKRLPVWRLDYDTEQGDKLFIDPATGVLVDRLVDSARYESYAFSFLHKWNFLRPIMSRGWRDSLMVGVLSLAIMSTVFGYILLWRRRNGAQRREGNV